MTEAATVGEVARAPGNGRGLVAVAEHEPEVAEMIRQYLSRSGLSSWHTANPAEAVATLRAREAVAYVLDLTMPGLDVSLVRRTLGSGAAARAVFLVDSRGVRPRGLGAGPGERRWLTRPFSPRALAEMVCELAVPVAVPVPAIAPFPAVGPFPAIAPVLAVGPGRAVTDGRAAANDPPESGLNAASRTVSVSGREVSLTRSEFALLAALTSAAGRVLTRDQLLQRLAAERGKVPGPRAIDVYITQLRAKLGDGAIRTVRGAGYAVDRPVSTVMPHLSNRSLAKFVPSWVRPQKVHTIGARAAPGARSTPDKRGISAGGPARAAAAVTTTAGACQSKGVANNQGEAPAQCRNGASIT